MEFVTLALTGAKYILKAITGSKAVDNAKEELLGKFWKWVKHPFFKESKLTETVLEQLPEKTSESLIQQELLKLMEQESFRREFQAWVIALDAHVVPTKNEFSGEIDEIGKSLSIGDRTEGPSNATNDDSHFTRKNIFSGKVGKVTGDVQIGDITKNKSDSSSVD